MFAVPNTVLSVEYRSHSPLYAVLYSSLSHTCLLYKHSALCTVPLSLSPICCIVQFTQSHLVALPNTVLSVHYLSQSPLYALSYSSLSHTCLLYQTLRSLYSTNLTLPYMLYSTVHSVTPVCCTKHSALCTVPLSHSPICCIVQFTQSQLFALPNTPLSLYSTALTLPYMLYCTVHSVTPVCCTKHSALCTVTLSLSPIFCTVQFTQSHLFDIANILLSVRYRSHSPLYAVLYSSLSPPLCCTKHCALCTVPLSLSTICFIVQFTQSQLFAVPKSVLSLKYCSHPILYDVLYSSLIPPFCCTKH
jgi:hypothetical protein